jgi:hypothetical protein
MLAYTDPRDGLSPDSMLDARVEGRCRIPADPGDGCASRQALGGLGALRSISQDRRDSGRATAKALTRALSAGKPRLDMGRSAAPRPLADALRAASPIGAARRGDPRPASVGVFDTDNAQARARQDFVEIARALSAD